MFWNFAEQNYLASNWYFTAAILIKSLFSQTLYRRSKEIAWNHKDRNSYNRRKTKWGQCFIKLTTYIKLLSDNKQAAVHWKDQEHCGLYTCKKRIYIPEGPPSFLDCTVTKSTCDFWCPYVASRFFIYFFFIFLLYRYVIPSIRNKTDFLC